jgi:molybdopterin-guanine dinucleotide biosynthesis protein A
MTKRGGIILCGGRSSRMGTPKLQLPFGPELMLQRIVRLLAEVCHPIVIVAASDQHLPELPLDVIVVHDEHEGRGPLEGLLAGLRALPAEVDLAYATGCDVPLLAPGFVRRMFELMGDHSAAVPVSEGLLHPLAAVYRRSLIPVVEALLAAQRRRPSDVFDTVSTRRVEPDELADVDPALDTLKNVNHPADYLAALASVGLRAPDDVLATLRMND